MTMLDVTIGAIQGHQAGFRSGPKGSNVDQNGVIKMYFRELDQKFGD